MLLYVLCLVVLVYVLEVVVDVIVYVVWYLCCECWVGWLLFVVIVVNGFVFGCFDCYFVWMVVCG